jgi:hypothetical protein
MKGHFMSGLFVLSVHIKTISNVHKCMPCATGIRED